MDGLELCRRIRALSGRPYTYFVLVTARGGHEDRLEALAAGADDFLAKPFDTRELVARLEIAHRLLAMQEELERKNAALRALATTDELTGLKNRRRFFEDLESQFALAARQRSPLSLVLLDVDHFKAYNDAFGHPAGDDVLRGVADALRSVTRGHDTVARYGGEEFAVLLPGTGPDVARGMAERLREAIERRAWPHRPVTASFGVATTTPGTGAAQELVDQADRRPLPLQTPRPQPRHPPGRPRGPPREASRRPSGSISRHPESSDVPIRLPPTGPGSSRPGDRRTGADLRRHRRGLVARAGPPRPRDGRPQPPGHRDDARPGPGPRHRRGRDGPHPPRRPAPRHRQDGHPRRDPAQARPARPTRSGRSCGGTRSTPTSCSPRSPSCGRRWTSPTATTSGGTAPATRAGSKGEQIPLAARIFAAVDIWDALSHDRPYRKAWPEERVRAHIAALAGTHLDPGSSRPCSGPSFRTAGPSRRNLASDGGRRGPRTTPKPGGDRRAFRGRTSLSFTSPLMLSGS